MNFLVGQDQASCLIIGRNSVLICQENQERIELKSSLLNVKSEDDQ